ncbi:helix-turn-helix domain-containing protein [Rhizobium sp.]|uniref:helix-turn-helix domain-containing protein n=1 Tax=Rhizobium sp. TaxID=391 RepID=UPI00289A841A
MTQITSDTLADMHARRLRGESCADIARSYGIKEMTVYQRLRREFGLDIYKQRPVAANDNVPGRVRKMAAHNGGCSTLSGMMPVTLAEVATVERPAVAMSQREQEMAVAA